MICRRVYPRIAGFFTKNPEIKRFLAEARENNALVLKYSSKKSKDIYTYKTLIGMNKEKKLLGIKRGRIKEVSLVNDGHTNKYSVHAFNREPKTNIIVHTQERQTRIETNGGSKDNIVCSIAERFFSSSEIEQSTLKDVLQSLPDNAMVRFLPDPLHGYQNLKSVLCKQFIQSAKRLKAVCGLGSGTNHLSVDKKRIISDSMISEVNSKNKIEINA